MNIGGIGTKLIGKIKKNQDYAGDSGQDDSSATSCRVCGMEFADTQRLYKHMAKAHSRPMGQRKNRRQRR